MQIPLLHQQILIASERLRDIHRSIMSRNSPVPSAEMESLLQEIRNLYSIALQLNNENALQLLNEVQLAIKPPVAPTPKPENKQPEVAETKPVEIKKIVEKVQPVSYRDPEHATRMTDTNGKYHDSPKLADRFADHKTLADIISSVETTRRVSDSLRTSVKDIKAAIGINEKFQFINHLFNGDAKRYHDMIDELNNSRNAETAMKIVSELSEKHSWDSYPASAKSFIDIVERRFSA